MLDNDARENKSHDTPRSHSGFPAYASAMMAASPMDNFARVLEHLNMPESCNELVGHLIVWRKSAALACASNCMNIYNRYGTPGR